MNGEEIKEFSAKLDFWFIVDYDLPVDGRRGRFYRALKKLLAEYEALGDYSTESVFVTDDYNLAKQVHLLAMAVGGKSRLYLAFQIYDDKTLRDILSRVARTEVAALPATQG